MNISRKNFLVGAAATAITAPAVDGASLGGMSARARGLMGGAFMGCLMAQQNRNPYITDGLVGFWDAEWNGGLGIHDSNRRMVNIMLPDESIPFLANTTHGDNYILCPQGSSLSYNTQLSVINNLHTIESCGCLLGRPTNVSNFSGACSFLGLSVAMWRYNWDVSGVLVSSYIDTNRINYVGFGDRESSMIEANNEVFGIARTRSVHTGNGVSLSDVRGYINATYKGTAYRMDYTDAYTANHKVMIGSAYSATTKIHCYRVYNRVLTDAELAHNHRVDKARFSLP